MSAALSFPDDDDDEQFLYPIDNDADFESQDLFEFLQANPDFLDRPATIEEFIGPDYLDLEKTIRASVRAALVEIFGDYVRPDRISEARRAMFTGAIGIGKTTLASIAIPYMVHWVLCLKDPQEYFGLMPRSRIAFMLMSTTDAQAKEVLFGDIKARLSGSPWAKRMDSPWPGSPWDPAFKNQLRFPKEIWVLPGNSKEKSFEGYNILGGIIDEGDSHQITANKDYAQVGYETIHNRISSRFIDPVAKDHRGLLIVIGQMKSASGFMSRKMKELEGDEGAVVIRLTQWESFGWQTYKNEDGTYDVFWYDIERKCEVSPEYARDIKSDSIIPIPNAYKKDFDTNPVKALRDLAGIPPEATDPFIAVMERVQSAQLRWHQNHPDIDQPVNKSCTMPLFHERLVADSSIKRVLHIDIAYSDATTADALGMAMGHVSKLVDLNGDIKPYIVIDFLMRIKAQTGSQIMLEDVRSYIYALRDIRGYKIRQVTVDGTNSVDMMQTLIKRRIPADYLSVDRNKTPYEDLREAIYERRIEFPAYVTMLAPGSVEQVVIAERELRQLNDTGKKVDHPQGGSKDVADAIAGVTHVLTGSPEYRRGLRKPSLEEKMSEVAMEYGNGYDPNFHKDVLDVEAVDLGGLDLSPDPMLMRELGAGPPSGGDFPDLGGGLPDLSRYPGPKLERLPDGHDPRTK